MEQIAPLAPQELAEKILHIIERLAQIEITLDATGKKLVESNAKITALGAQLDKDFEKLSNNT